MKRYFSASAVKSKLLKLLLAVALLGAVLCVQGCTEDDANNPLLPAPWLPVF
jgi:hypothetical protein